MDNNRLKVRTPRGIIYCQLQKNGLYKKYNQPEGGRTTGLLNLTYALSLNDGLYEILA